MDFHKRHLFEAMTRWNYFPNQKDGVGELPPIVSSRRFTPEISSCLLDTRKRHGGYGVVEYRSTRFNNIPRVLSLVHPRAISEVVNVYNDNWDCLKPVYENCNSMVKPDAHPDGRAFIMNYEAYEDKVFNGLDKSFAKRFRVHTDIANCFGSIYTHSVEWALRGFDETKVNMSVRKQDKKNHWSEELDKHLRSTKRNETQGIPIGPAISSLAVELILGAVDRSLCEKYEFFRYIDDYTCLCDTHEEARSFLRDLSGELSKFKLSLNLHKTSIVEQPEPLQPAWVSDLVRARPNLYFSRDVPARKMTTFEVVHFLDFAIRLNNETEDGSVLKFAVSSIVRNVDGQAAEMLRDYVVNLSFHFPILLPYLDELPFPELEDYAHKYEEKINSIVVESCQNGRSDGMAWSLYYLIANKREVYKETVEAVLDSRDCVSMAILASQEDLRKDVVEFVSELRSVPEFKKDEYWLLLYQLYYYGDIEDFYSGDGVFEILKEHDVNFLPEGEEETSAEHYCMMLTSGFMDPPQTFEEWNQAK
ncbi:RNA-directed DNA polymerase [Halomonas cupida]|uniref:antiviral reverse transcriptase Drt4 n=1 Tax=Halomonas cupida TaxID=44933 RepID=UPI0039B53D61